jgi:outer membrane protein TolC
MKLLLVAATMGLAAAPCAAAQESAAASAIVLTVEEAVRRGLDESHRLRETAARGDAAAAAVGERRAAALPQLALQAGFMRTNHVEQFGVIAQDGRFRVIYPDVPDNYRSRLDAQWPLYTGGRLIAAERAARYEADAALDDLQTARADVRLEVTRAYWELVTALESARVVDAALERTQTHLRDMNNQFGAGLIPPNDVSLVQAQESRQRLLRIQARAARDVAEAALARLIGAPAGARIQPASPLDVPPAGERPDRSLVEISRENRGERAALLDRLRAAAERTRAAQAGAKPTVAVAAGLDYTRPNPRIFPRADAWRSSWDAAVNVSWPLFDGGRTRAEVAGAAAGARAAQARLDDFDAALEVELRQRTSDLDAARASVAAADDGVRAAGDARRVAGDRFAAGVATSTDVVDAQLALLQAELDRAHAIAGVRLAEARLSRALGQQ